MSSSSNRRIEVTHLEPIEVVGGLEQVVAQPAGDGHEGHRVRVVADFLQVRVDLLLYLIEPGLWSHAHIL